jgi:hypothetical protein
MDSAIDPTTVVSLSPAISIRLLGDCAVILNTDSAELYSCNQTASAFLRQVDGTRTLAEVVEAVLPAYDADPKAIYAELAALAGRLRAAGIISIP